MLLGPAGVSAFSLAKIIAWITFGAVGFAAFVYGKKERSFKTTCCRHRPDGLSLFRQRYVLVVRGRYRVVPGVVFLAGLISEEKMRLLGLMKKFCVLMPLFFIGCASALVAESKAVLERYPTVVFDDGIALRRIQADRPAGIDQAG